MIERLQFPEHVYQRAPHRRNAQRRLGSPVWEHAGRCRDSVLVPTMLQIGEGELSLGAVDSRPRRSENGSDKGTTAANKCRTWEAS